MNRKAFFSEEKKQKTFMSFAAPAMFRHREPPLCGAAIQSRRTDFCRVTLDCFGQAASQ
jgi:hypothetical protein